MPSAPELCFVSHRWREPSWAYRGWAAWSSEPAHEVSPGCPELGVDSILFPWCSLCGRSHRVFPYPFQCVVLSVEGTLSLDWIRVGCFNEYLENGINSSSNLGDLEQSWLSSRDTSLITYLQDLRGRLVSENDNKSLAFICVCEHCLQFPEGTDFRCNGKEEAKDHSPLERARPSEQLIRDLQGRASLTAVLQTRVKPPYTEFLTSKAGFFYFQFLHFNNGFWRL